MSIPTSTCLRTTPAMPDSISAASCCRSYAAPLRRAFIPWMIAGVRIRLPAWVVRIRSVLRCTSVGKLDIRSPGLRALHFVQLRGLERNVHAVPKRERLCSAGYGVDHRPEDPDSRAREGNRRRTKGAQTLDRFSVFGHPLVMRGRVRQGFLVQIRG